MFYAHFVLAKKGPLAKIWLAAHWDKKLTKAHVFETNIEKSVDGILKPKVKMALRTSGHLLLGVVRIYSRKAKYLLQDCNEAFVKIKMAFRPGMVDLPEEHREAAMNAITLPEVFHDFDTAMPELNEVDIEAQFSLNQSRAEEITMREDYGSLNLVAHDDGFGDMGFDTDHPDIMREAIGSEAGLEQSNLLFADGSSLDLAGKDGGIPTSSGVVPQLVAPEHEPRMEVAPHPHMDDGFGGTIGDVGDFGHAGGLFEGDLFGDVSAGPGAGATPRAAEPQSLQAEIEAGVGNAAQAATDPPDSDDDMGDHYDAGNSPAPSWGRSPIHTEADHPEPALEPPPPIDEPTPMEVDVMPPPAPPAASPAPPPDHDNTTLLHNDEESFALAPVDATVLKGITKTRRKRKLIVDEVKNISGEEMKNQLSNTSDIITTLDLAPPTRRLMHWKETGGVEKLFTLPAVPIPSQILFRKYQRNLALRDADEEPAAADGARHDEPVTRRGPRKRKLQDVDPPPELEPPTPVPHEYEPSVEAERAPETPAYAHVDQDIEPPTTPGMLSSLGPPLTPGVLGPLTPGTLLQGGLTPGATPAGLQHGGMTPGALQHGDSGDLGLTPAGLVHGGMTPAGLGHGGMTPAGLGHGGLTPAGLGHGGLTPAGLGHGGLSPPGLGHGGLTPAGLGHGGLTPAGLGHGGMTPSGLGHGGMTPVGLVHGGMTPVGLGHGGMTPVGLQHGGMTPAGLQHGLGAGGMTPSLGIDGGLTPVGLGHGGGFTPADLHHGSMTPGGLEHGELLAHALEPLPMMPQLGGDVTSILDRSEPLQGNMQMTNLGYDEHHGGHSPHHDYELPPSVEQIQEVREAGETEEQFSERVLNRRAAQLFTLIKPRLLHARATITFYEMATAADRRKLVAQKFYSLLVLKKHQALTLLQDEPYGNIVIGQGANFHSDSL